MSNIRQTLASADCLEMYGFEHRLRAPAFVRKRTMEILGFLLRSNNKRLLRGLWHDSCFAKPDTAAGYHS
jgi:hypothetical protein